MYLNAFSFSAGSEESVELESSGVLGLSGVLDSLVELELSEVLDSSIELEFSAELELSDEPDSSVVTEDSATFDSSAEVDVCESEADVFVSFPHANRLTPMTAKHVNANNLFFILFSYPFKFTLSDHNSPQSST